MKSSLSKLRLKVNQVVSIMLTCSLKKLKVARMQLEIWIKLDHLVTRQLMLNTGLAKLTLLLKENRTAKNNLINLLSKLFTTSDSSSKVVTRIAKETVVTNVAIRLVKVANLKQVLTVKPQSQRSEDHNHNLKMVQHQRQQHLL